MLFGTTKKVFSIIYPEIYLYRTTVSIKIVTRMKYINLKMLLSVIQQFTMNISQTKQSRGKYLTL